MALLCPPGSTWRCETGPRLHAVALCVLVRKHGCRLRCIDVDTLAFLGLFMEQSVGLICCRPTGRPGCVISPICLRTNLGFTWEIRQRIEKVCRLRSQRGTYKNECVCLCVVYACLENTLCEVLLLLTLYGETSGWISSVSGPAAMKTIHNMARPAWPVRPKSCRAAAGVQPWFTLQNTHILTSQSVLSVAEQDE